MKINELIIEFEKPDMFDADKRRRFETAVGDLYSVLTVAGPKFRREYPSSFDFAEWSVDKYSELWDGVCD